MVKPIPFDAARYTTSPAGQQEFLDDAFATETLPTSPTPSASLPALAA